MKRIYTLIVLLAIAAGFLTGCGESSSTTAPTPDTNAPAVTPPSTNK